MTATAVPRSAGTPRPIDLTDTRNLLEGLHVELSAEIDEVVAMASMTDARGQFVGDEGDSGLAASQREQAITLLASVRARREQVERALHRVEAGTYGICETCDDRIAPERLEVYPAGTECIACRRARERRA